VLILLKTPPIFESAHKNYETYQAENSPGSLMKGFSSVIGMFWWSRKSLLFEKRVFFSRIKC